MALYQLGDVAPNIGANAYVVPGATVIGRVGLKVRASVWPGVVIRSDNEPVIVGEASNAQEGSVLHTDPGCPLNIDDRMMIGHQAMLHGCTIGEGSLIGIQAVVLSRAVIGKNCLVNAGAIVTEGKVFEDSTLILGVPAKAMRKLTEDDTAEMHLNTETYVVRQVMYKQQLKRIDG